MLVLVQALVLESKWYSWTCFQAMFVSLLDYVAQFPSLSLSPHSPSLFLSSSLSENPFPLSPALSILSALLSLFFLLSSLLFCLFFCPAVSYTGVGCGVRINSFRILESWWDSGTCCEAVFISLLAALAQVLKLLNHFDMRAHVWICVYLPAGRSGTCYGALESIWHSCTCLEAPLRRGMDLNEPV